MQGVEGDDAALNSKRFKEFFDNGVKKPNKDHLWIAMMVVTCGAFGKSLGVSQE